jgi:hypothetical protein
MADIAQVLATGGTALVSAAAGAGLTYWLGALNRRHQEAREDKTRWYEARLDAYTAMPRVIGRGIDMPVPPESEAFEAFIVELTTILSAIRLVGSEETVAAAQRLFRVSMSEFRLKFGKDEGATMDVRRVNASLMEFVAAARKDLGHP